MMKIVEKTWNAEQDCYKYELAVDALSDIDIATPAAGSIAMCAADGKVYFYAPSGSWVALA